MHETRTSLNNAAAEYMKHCAEFLAAQNEAMAKEIESGAAPSELKERLWKINLVNDTLT